MASSDSEEFASADEAASVDGSEQRRRRSKRTSSSNYDSEDGAAARTGVTPAQTVPNVNFPGKPAVASPDQARPTDGWDDFEIDEEPTSISLTDKAFTPTDTSAQTVMSTPKVETVKKPDCSSQVKGVDVGWDQFDDWGQDDANSAQAENVSKPTSAPQEEGRITSVADRLSGLSVGGRGASADGGGGGGWGWGWGVDSLLSTASAGISTLTSTVSQGLSTVSNALESSIGAPDPEELAKRNLENVEEPSEASTPAALSSEPAGGEDVNRPTSNEGFAFGNLMSGVSHITKFVENTGSKVITGGLDTLETIGKKTMEVLQDGDPGLARKRAMLGLDGGDKPVLSQILREAKSRADDEDRLREQKREAKEVHYETLFDDFEGLVHLEALEMLSRQVGMRLEERLRGLSADKRQEMKETLQQVAELCEMPEEEDEEDTNDEKLTGPETLHNKLREATQDLGITLQFQPLVKQWEGVASWLGEGGTDAGAGGTERAVYKRGVGALAQCTALAVELYHKAAELLLVKARRSTADEADALTQMTSVLTRHVSRVATVFTDRLSELSTDANKEEVNTYITNVFLEAGNSSTYIQNAFHLTLPVLQIGAA